LAARTTSAIDAALSVMLRDMNLWWNCRMIRRRKLRLLLAVGFLSFPLLAWLELAARYGADVRGLTLWSKTHVGTLVRVDKRVGAAWVYINWHGDYLGFVDESPNYGPYLLRTDRNRVAAGCAVKPLGQVGDNHILTPAYAGGLVTRCVTMDDVKYAETTWVQGQDSIDFHSVPYDWPLGTVRGWFLAFYRYVDGDCRRTTGKKCCPSSPAFPRLSVK